MKNYYILKNYCSFIFRIGSGNFWYENNSIRDDKSFLYRFCSSVLFLLYVIMTVLEIMAALIGDFPEDEKSDSITFAVSHTVVMTKIFWVISNKDHIKNLNRRMIEVCAPYEDEKLMAEKYRIVKLNVVGYFALVYISVLFFVFEGLRKLHAGSIFITIVTYYPSSEDKSIAATSFRVATTIILCMMMLTMIATVDSFTMAYLIMYKYKFITLRQFFENLKVEFDRLNKSGCKDIAAEKFTQGLVEGVIMHNEVLRLSKDIDKAFGLVMALQVCMSSASAVSLLLQIALSDQLTFVAGMKIVFFVFGLFFMLALFLCNAGEITYQASLLSDAIFYCGWSSCPPRVGGRNIRKIVHLAVMQAQRPLIMKAFKMLELTYSTFLMVVRTTYSVFALIYAKRS